LDEKCRLTTTICLDNNSGTHPVRPTLNNQKPNTDPGERDLLKEEEKLKQQVPRLMLVRRESETFIPSISFGIWKNGEVTWSGVLSNSPPRK
jgi:hypothetical protein